MIISISGTPGTGKTKAARLLGRKMKANIIPLKALCKDISCKYDKKRKTKIVDIKDLQQSASKKIIKNKINIIEGHLSHFLKADVIVILRTNPIVLEKRLKKRKWRKSKIKENVMAEFLDEITTEAIEKHGRKKVFEIDASRTSEKKAAGIIAKILAKKGEVLNKYRAGRIDWSEKYKKYMIGEKK